MYPSAPAVSHSDHAFFTVLHLTNSLPNETLIIIFYDFSPADLASVARACHQRRVAAERLMYTNSFISETLSPSSHFRYNTARCCLTTASHPHLASVLRKLHVRWISDHADHHSDPHLGTTLPPLCDQPIKESGVFGPLPQPFFSSRSLNTGPALFAQ